MILLEAEVKWGRTAPVERPRYTTMVTQYLQAKKRLKESHPVSLKLLRQLLELLSVYRYFVVQIC